MRLSFVQRSGSKGSTWGQTLARVEVTFILLLLGCRPPEPPGELVVDLAADARTTRGALGARELALGDIARWREDLFGHPNPALWLPLEQADTTLATRGPCTLSSSRRLVRGTLRDGDSTLYSLESDARGRTPVTISGACTQLVLGDDEPPAPRSPNDEGLALPAGWFAQLDHFVGQDETLVLESASPVRVSLRNGDGSLRYRTTLRAGRVPLRTEGIARIRVGAGPDAAVNQVRARIERAARAAAPPPAPVRGVVLLLIDTLRADRVGAVSGSFPTPALDAVGAAGAVFEHAYSTAAWTKPAVGSVLTGLHPWEHRAITHRAALRPDIELLPERLQAAGVTTAALVANGYVSARFGFDRGWDRFEHTGLREHVDGPGGGHHLIARARDFVSSRAPDERFFLYLHTTDVHAPYRPDAALVHRFDSTPDYAGAIDFERTPDLMRMIEQGELSPDAADRQRLRALYDAGVVEHDEELTTLLQELLARDDILLIVVADHGEELFDHGSVGHGGRRLHEELVHVPLLVRWPATFAPGTRVRSPVSLVDLSPTVLEALGLPSSIGSTRARSLRLATEERGRRVTFGDADLQRGITDGRYKYVLRSDGSAALYDLREDPSEAVDLAATHSVLREAMQAELARYLTDAPTFVAPPTQDAPLDSDLSAQLRALGYLDEETSE